MTRERERDRERDDDDDDGSTAGEKLIIKRNRRYLKL